MTKGLMRALRFAVGWKSGAQGVVEEEVEIQRVDGPVPGTLLRPRGGSGLRPGWVVLHGITRPGRRHPTLLRFAGALARSGAVVLVPEIPEWRSLHLAPEAVADTVRAAVLHLAELRMATPGGIGIVGFSFGVTQALLAAADPQLSRRLGGVAGFGGYCDFERTLRFLFQGTHEWEASHSLGDPDPYGRWVIGGNLLPATPGFEGTEAVAEALLALAREAGDLQVGSWEAVFDQRKGELEGDLSPSHRELFRAFAPPSNELPPEDFSRTMVPALARTARESSPLLDPLPLLNRISVPVRLIHGREDRLIPFSETLRLKAGFPPQADVRVYLTGLFAHSRRDTESSSGNQLKERLRFVRMLSDLLGLL
jgi:pimeloyl-ACP methyl ester carboxylesterase